MKTLKHVRIISSSIILASTLLLSGCATTQVYTPQYIPEPVEPPKFVEYNVQLVTIDDTEYFLLDKENMNKLALNWLDYKRFAETNYDILKDLHKKYINKIKNDK